MMPRPPRPLPGRAALLALALGLGLAPQARAQAPGNATLTMGVQSTFGIDPHFLFLGPNMAAARHIYDTLINRDPESRFIPGLTTSWTPVSDTVWELKLRPGVTFQDGSPFTAEDVAFSIKRIPQVPNNPGPYTSNLRTITEVEVVDPLTVRIHTDRPNPTLPGQLTNVFIVSAKAAAGATTGDFSSGKAAIGTGPFRLEKFNGAEGMTVVRNDTYWGKPAAYARVQVKVMANDAARLAALLAGDVDLIEDVAPGDVARLERDDRVSVFKRSSDRIMYVIPNIAPEHLPLLTDANGQPLPTNPLKDLRVRKALSLAIDRAALTARALDGQAIPTIQLVPEGFGAWDPTRTAPAVDPEAAKRLLAEAGYPDGLGLTIGCSNNRYVNDARVCQALGQMLSRAGFHAKVETQPGSVFFPRTVVGKNDVPLILYGLSLSSSRDASYILASAVHTRNVKEAFGQGNRGGFTDPSIDTLIDAAATRMDDGREAALRNAAAVAVEALPLIPLYNQVTITAARRGVVYTPRMDEQLVGYYAHPAAKAAP